MNRRGTPKVLLVGYNGANNTGSEARLLPIIDDIREVFGPSVRITVPTLNEKNLRRYVKEGPDLSIEPVPSIFFFALRRLVREHDIVMLVEGSCYMDTWTPAQPPRLSTSTGAPHAASVSLAALLVQSGTPGVTCRTLRRWGAVLRPAQPSGESWSRGGKAKGVELERGSRRVRAEVVVLAAGGIGTAQVLRNSGYPPRKGLWADVVLTLGGALEGANQIGEAPMAWYAERGDYILSPYPDILSHWFHDPWRSVPLSERVGLMAKLADEPKGYLTDDGVIIKSLTDLDWERLREAMALAGEVMEAAGVSGPFVEGLANGGHLGGTVPLSREDAQAMRPSWLPDCLWVADLSLVPASQGLPTILTTASIALRVARRIAEETGA